MTTQTKTITFKQVNTTAIIAFAGLAFLMTMMLHVHTARAADSDCFPISKSGVPVLVPPVTGVANSGVMMFDPVGGVPADNVRSCAYDPGDDAIAPFILKGWVWNSNLGWVSLYCGDEGLGFKSNRGISCGTYDYSVEIDSNGKFTGYAYGDNVGYIKFDNGAFAQLQVEKDNSKCQGYVYSTDAFVTAGGASCAAAPHAALGGKKLTSVWADSVGWIDLENVLFPWYTLTKSIKDAYVTVNLSPFPTIGAAPGNPLTSVEASSGHQYTLTASIHDKLGAAVEGPRYEVTIVPTWSKDTVKKDQTSTTDKLDDPVVATPCTADGKRAVTKPCLPAVPAPPAPFAHTAGSLDYTASISSIAPTSNENQSIKSDGTYAENEKFILPKDKKLEVREPNDLILANVAVKVWDKDADQCAYADDWIACTPKVRPVNGFLGNIPLRFSPATKFQIDNPVVGAIDYLSAIAGNTGSLIMNKPLTAPGTIKLYSGVDPDSGDYKFGFTTTQETSSPDDILTSPLVFTNQTLYTLLASIKGQVNAYISGLYVYSVIDEGSGVKYFGNKLPRVVGSYGVQPVAITTGNVYGTCLSQTTSTAKDLRSLGDISSNKLRDTFAKNVAALIAGLNNSYSWGSETTIDINTLNNCTSSGSLMCAANKSVLYVKGNALLSDSSGTITWSGNKTIIVIGGKLRINSNLYNAAPGSAKPRLGIIVMKDYTDTSNPHSNTAGNIYIESKVTDIQANMVAPDGALLSYVDDGAHGIDLGTGEPKYSSPDDMTAQLEKNQLWITGSLASNNTIGGATATSATNFKMYNGMCQVETSSQKARYYDLNYLRQYVGVYDRDPATLAPKDKYGNVATEDLLPDQLVNPATGKPISAAEGGWLYPPVSPPAHPAKQNPTGALGKTGDVNLGSTYLVFDPPPATLPGFAGENIFAVVIRPQ